jgi:hypothetical protein
MPLSAPATLAISAALSALGAVVLCLLIAFYGLTPASEPSPRRASRRRLITGIGHAVAATCFAATTILIAVVLVQPLRFAPAPPRDDARVPALGARLAGQESRLTDYESRLAGQESQLTGHESRLAGQESRLTGHESKLAGQQSRLAEAEARLQAIDDAVRRTAARQVHPAEPPVRRTATPPRQPATAPSARAVSLPERAPSSQVVVRPHDLEGSAFTMPPAPSPVAPLATNAPAPPPAVGPALPVTPSAGVPGAAPPPTPPARRVATDPTPAPAGRPGPAAPPSRSGLLDKLREDWATIRRSFESGEDDFRRAMEDTRRNFRGLTGE